MPNPVDAEQAHLSTFYAALDFERERTERRTSEELLVSTRNAQALNQRDGRIRDLGVRLARLNSGMAGQF